MPRELSDDEAKSLGLTSEPQGRELSDDEAAALGLPSTPVAAARPSKLDQAMAWLKSKSGAVPATVGLMPLPDMSKPRIGFSAVPVDEEGVAATLNGVTQGLAPRLAAAVTGEPLDDARRYFTRAEAARPEESLAGAAMLPIPGPKGTGVLPSLARIGIGAGLGALNAEERAPEAEALDSGKRGGELAAGVGAAAEALPMVGRMAPALRQIAERNAVYAMAPGGQIGDKLAKRGYTEPGGADALALGRSMLDEKLVPWFGNSTSINERANSLQQDMGAKVGAALDAAAATGQQPDQTRAAWSAVAKMGGPLGPNAQEAAASGKGVALAQGMADEAGRGLSPQEAWREMNRYKSQAWNSANFKDDAPLVAQQYRKAVSGMRDSIGDQVAEVAGQKVGDQLRDANRRFGVAADVADMSADRVRRDFFTKGNAAAAITGAGMAASMSANGASPLMAMGAASVPLIGKALLSPANVARGADAAAGLASQLPQRSIGTPAATSAAARKLWEWYGVQPKDEDELSKVHAEQQLPGM